MRKVVAIISAFIFTIALTSCESNNQDTKKERSISVESALTEALEDYRDCTLKESWYALFPDAYVDKVIMSRYGDYSDKKRNEIVEVKKIQLDRKLTEEECKAIEKAYGAILACEDFQNAHPQDEYSSYHEFEQAFLEAGKNTDPIFTVEEGYYIKCLCYREGLDESEDPSSANSGEMRTEKYYAFRTTEEGWVFDSIDTFPNSSVCVWYAFMFPELVPDSMSVRSRISEF